MTDAPAPRALNAHERALLAAVTNFCLLPATGLHGEDKHLLMRIEEVLRAVMKLPQVDRFQIEHGPLTNIFYQARDLIDAVRDREGENQKRRQARYLALLLFPYFEGRTVTALRAHGLPDHVPEPPKEPVF